MKYTVEVAGRSMEVELIEGAGGLSLSVDGKPFPLDYREVDTHGQVVCQHEGQSFALSIEGDGHATRVTLAGHDYFLEIEDERERAANLAASAANKGGGKIKAVMPGVVVELMVEPGQQVSEGQPLLILEAMKMQNEIGAPGDGVVDTLHVAAGQAVSTGDPLVTLKALPES
ncbi:MAG: biotin carboxyl carrier protein [Planctomycetota bacterium]|jgi:biotin carboxyl carrier protein